MRSLVTIVFSSRQTLEQNVDIEPSAQASASARDWFDATWVRLGCEPLRPSGKVLLLDKVLGVADALGYQALSQDEAAASEFATQAAFALQKPRITVDLPGSVVGY